MIFLSACGRTAPYDWSTVPIRDADAGHDAGVDGRPDAGTDGGVVRHVPAHIVTTTDDFMRLWINGVLVGDDGSEWSTPKSYDVEIFCGSNNIALEGRNMWNTDGLDRGIILDLAYAGSHVVTDSTWRVLAAPPSGWTDPSFDDNAWAPATDIGPEGEAPWGAVIGPSSAHWIWSYDPNLPGSMKVEAETIGARKTFVAVCP
jgi:hypothetical protein